MNAGNKHEKKPEPASSSAPRGKDPGAKKIKPGSASRKTGKALNGKERGFDDLDEMRKDIDALGGLFGADGRPVP